MLRPLALAVFCLVVVASASVPNLVQTPYKLVIVNLANATYRIFNSTLYLKTSSSNVEELWVGSWDIVVNTDVRTVTFHVSRDSVLVLSGSKCVIPYAYYVYTIRASALIVSCPTPNRFVVDVGSYYYEFEVDRGTTAIYLPNVIRKVEVVSFALPIYSEVAKYDAFAVPPDIYSDAPVHVKLHGLNLETPSEFSPRPTAVVVDDSRIRDLERQIGNLREALDNLSKEKDLLERTLSEVMAENADLKDALHRERDYGERVRVILIALIVGLGVVGALYARELGVLR